MQQGKCLDVVHSFKTKDEQDIYLQGLIEATQVKNRRPRIAENPGKRSSSFKFFIMIGDKRQQVCKNAFLQLYAVSEKRVRRLQNLLLLGKSPRDLRGQQDNRKTVPQNAVEQIKSHIKSFPIKVSHHTSKEIEYLDAKLDINKMYMLFREKYADTTVKYSFYYKIFRESFDYRFGKPQIDTCGECEQLKVKIKNSNLNDCAKRVASAELSVHERRSRKFYESIKKSKELSKKDCTVLGLAFDYMQNISIPCIPVQELYYFRQLSVFPFAIHNLKNDKADFFLYHEGIAKKGPNETCSFLWKYLNENISSSVRELHLYSDSCGGQNKNHCMIRFLLSLTDMRKFDKIIHRFPIRGHSFLACDRDFGQIKRTLNKVDRFYEPSQICEMVCSAGTPGKFTVHMIDSDDVLDFKSWWPKRYKKNCLSSETQSKSVPRSGKQEFSISHFMEFRYDSSLKGTVVTSQFIGGFTNTFVLHHKSQQNATCTMPTEKAYSSSKVPINEEKLKDIAKSIKYIPEENQEFYREILNWPKA